MKVLTGFQPGISQAEKERALDSLRESGFKQAPDQAELRELGMLAGELPKIQFARLQKKFQQGELPALSFLEADELRTVQD